MVMDNRERFTFRIPTELLHAIKKQAKQIGVSTNALILQILWEYVEDTKRTKEVKQ